MSIRVTSRLASALGSPSSSTNLIKLAKINILASKTIIIECQPNLLIKLSFPLHEETNLTCQWLFHEVIRKIRDESLKKSLNIDTAAIIALKTKNQCFSLDSWLAFPERNISVLQDGQILVPVFGFSKKEKPQRYASKLSKDDFIFETRIGKGGFADVYLVRSLRNGRLYAVKRIKKDTKNKQLIKAIEREKEILCAMRGQRNVTQIHFAFQDEEYCYLGIDFCAGGSLHYHLRKIRCFPEETARILIAQAILCLQTLHENNILYRDLKPENLLLDSNGDIRITDFGLSKKVTSSRSRNYSICGTFDSIAPEMGRPEGHSFQVDYYALGILAYELVVGLPPASFYIRGEKGKLLKNPKHTLRLPNHCSEELRNFIEKLLDENPTSRLGATGGWEEIKSHPWFDSIKFQDITNGKKAIVIDPLCDNIDPKYLEQKDINVNDDGDTLVETKKHGFDIWGFEFQSDDFCQRIFKANHTKSQSQSTKTKSLSKSPVKVLNNSCIKKKKEIPRSSLSLSLTKPIFEKVECQTAKKKIYVSIEKFQSAISVKNTPVSGLNVKVDSPRKLSNSKSSIFVKQNQGLKIQTLSTEETVKGIEALETADSYLVRQSEMEENGQKEQSLSIKIGIHQLNPKANIKKRADAEIYKRKLEAFVEK